MAGKLVGKMNGDIEVEIELFQGYRHFLKTIRCTDFRVRRHPRISKWEYTDEGLLISNTVYNSEGSILHQMECAYDGEFTALEHRLPSGYTHKLEGNFFHADGNVVGVEYTNSIVDKEGRPHGLRTNQRGFPRWNHGHPETEYQMYIYEQNNTSDGRVFFTPLGDGLYLLDYYYIDCDQEICERFYNIYRLDPEGPVNLVFEKKHDHTFAIRPKGSHERYIDYNIPVQFINPDFQTPTQDGRFYALQKKVAQTYLEVHGFRPENYDNSTPYYETYIELYNRSMMAKEDKYKKEKFTYEELDFENGVGEFWGMNEGQEENDEWMYA